MPTKMSNAKLFCEIIFLLLASCDEMDSSVTEYLDVVDDNSPIINGYVTKNCTQSQNVKIEEAHDILFDAMNTTTSEYIYFRDCMKKAPRVEFACSEGQDIWDQIFAMGNIAFTTIYCKDLSDQQANGSAQANINGNNLSIDIGFINNNSARRIASVIAHELMHNRGYLHVVNDQGSNYYSNTVPEQVEACIRFGSPNSSRGPLTVTYHENYNEEQCNGPITSGTTIRRGMHACPIGYYMSGVHLNANEFLCRKLFLGYGSGYNASDEIIDFSDTNNSNSQEFGMHNCPDGYAMTGLHYNDDKLLCAPISKLGSRYVDYYTNRAGMHACKDSYVMTGLHGRNNLLTCK